MKRTNVEFVSGPRGEHCRAWIYEPDGRGPFPIIVMAHGLGGVKEMRLDAFATRFSSAGYACLVFDYRCFGASDGHPRQLLDIGSQLDDWSSAIAFVRQNETLRYTPVIVWGTSFGAGHAIVTAARDREIAAVIVQCPFTDGVASALAMDWQSSAKVTALGLFDWLRDLLGMSRIFVNTAGPAHSAALMTASDAHAGYLDLVPAGLPFRNFVAARAALDILAYRPGRHAAKLRCPILFCICELDAVAPARSSLACARRTPRAEICLYAYKHFDIYVGQAFERVVADQTAFLRRHVPAGRSTGRDLANG